MLSQNNTNGENEFAEMGCMNITVITSNEPYGISNGSNPFLYDLKKSKFNLTRNGVHSGHVQTGLSDPFCIAKNGRKDGFTAEVSGRKGVRVLVAVKPNRDKNSLLNREYFISLLYFPHYREVVYKLDLKGRRLGKNVVFDMDMSVGDFLTLFYLLKLLVEVINLKADIGLEMGIQGTRVAKESSNIIILDDNSASVVKATLNIDCYMPKGTKMLLVHPTFTWDPEILKPLILWLKGLYSLGGCFEPENEKFESKASRID